MIQKVKQTVLDSDSWLPFSIVARLFTLSSANTEKATCVRHKSQINQQGLKTDTDFPSERFFLFMSHFSFDVEMSAG